MNRRAGKGGLKSHLSNILMAMRTIFVIAMIMVAIAAGMCVYMLTFGAGVDSAFCIRAQVTALVVFQVTRLITEGEYGVGATIVAEKE
jgi:hypothetical protein